MDYLIILITSYELFWTRSISVIFDIEVCTRNTIIASFVRAWVFQTTNRRSIPSTNWLVDLVTKFRSYLGTIVFCESSEPTPLSCSLTPIMSIMFIIRTSWRISMHRRLVPFRFVFTSWNRMGSRMVSVHRWLVPFWFVLAFRFFRRSRRVSVQRWLLHFGLIMRHTRIMMEFWLRFGRSFGF